jgi:transposase InsO family protein
MAVKRRGGRCAKGLIVHSCTPTAASNTPANASADALSAHRVFVSMSRRGNCYDNAKAEAFFSSSPLSNSRLINRHRFNTRRDAQAIFRMDPGLLQLYNRAVVTPRSPTPLPLTSKTS